jgi:hypothetical protein
MAHQTPIRCVHVIDAVKVVSIRIGQVCKISLFALVTLSLAAREIFGPPQTEEPAKTVAESIQEVAPHPRRITSHSPNRSVRPCNSCKTANTIRPGTHIEEFLL